jgi:hypothetical protein
VISLWDKSMYTRYQKQWIRLHSSILCIATQHNWPLNASSRGGASKKAAGNRRPKNLKSKTLKFWLAIRPRPSAADRARRNCGSRPPGDR